MHLANVFDQSQPTRTAKVEWPRVASRKWEEYGRLTKEYFVQHTFNKPGRGFPNIEFAQTEYGHLVVAVDGALANSEVKGMGVEGGELFLFKVNDQQMVDCPSARARDQVIRSAQFPCRMTFARRPPSPFVCPGEHINLLGEPSQEDIQTTAPVNLNDPRVQELMMAQLLANMGLPYTEIVPLVDLGRMEDALSSRNYRLLIAATNADRHLQPALMQDRRLEIVQLPLVEGGDVGPTSFSEDQYMLQYALHRIDQVRAQGERVLVACQQGKDRSALVVLAYLMSKFSVTASEVTQHNP